jgi:hypothetical protein
MNETLNRTRKPPSLFSVLKYLPQFFICFIFTPPTHAYVRIYTLPSAATAVKSTSEVSEAFKGRADKIVAALTSEQPPDDALRIRELTAEEARKSLSGYFDKIGLSSDTQDRIFTDTYFGFRPNEIMPHDLNGLDTDHVSSTVYVSLRDAWRHSTHFKGSFGYPWNRWSFLEKLLSPREAFDIFKKMTAEELARPIALRSAHWEDLNDVSKLEFDPDNPKIAAIFNSENFLAAEGPSRDEKLLQLETFGFFNTDLVAEIYRSAEKIMGLTMRGDTLVILGNSPFFVGRALEHLASRNPEDSKFRQVIYFPFSGTPNKRRPNSDWDARNIVTPERFLHLQNRMRQSGLSHENVNLRKHGIYIIDIVGSGLGPAYLIETLLRNFKDNGYDPQLLNLNLITLNHIDRKADYAALRMSEPNPALQISKEDTTPDGYITLYFPTKHPGDVHFAINSYESHVKNHGRMDNFEHLKDGEYFRIFREYNACYWQPEYDWVLLSRFPKTALALIDYFDANMQTLTGVSLPRPLTLSALGIRVDEEKSEEKKTAPASASCSSHGRPALRRVTRRVVDGDFHISVMDLENPCDPIHSLNTPITAPQLHFAGPPVFGINAIHKGKELSLHLEGQRYSVDVLSLFGEEPVLSLSSIMRKIGVDSVVLYARKNGWFLRLQDQHTPYRNKAELHIEKAEEIKVPR